MKLAADKLKHLLCVATLANGLQYLVLVVQHLLRYFLQRIRFFIVLNQIFVGLEALLDASLVREEPLLFWL